MREQDYISYNRLAVCLNITIQTLNLYLCRAEFQHIFQFFIGKHKYVRNMTDKDVLRLRKLTTRKRGRKNRCEVKQQDLVNGKLK